MLLEIDIGNTRIKWRVYHQNQIIATNASLTSVLFEDNGLDSIFSELDLLSIDKAYVSNVVPRCHELLSQWADYYSIELFFAQTEDLRAGVQNGYHQVSQMGVDRWLALLAAYQQTTSPCLVVDAGSAVTVDLLRDGSHLGGYIVPGLNLMKASLFKDTGQVQVESDSYPDQLVAGTSTKRAVLSGLPLMLLGLISLAAEELLSSNKSLAIIVTGGDGIYLSKMLEKSGFSNVKYVPDLVLDGLQLSIE